MTVNKTRSSVSIVIPAYNEERHLRRCLQAIAAQTVQPLEVIVVDNNSADRTASVAREFSFVRVVIAEQQGIVFARNAGFDAARGDVIGRIDADINLPRSWVEHIQRFYADVANKDTAWTSLGFFHNVRLPRLVSWVYELVGFKMDYLLLGHYPLWGSSSAITAKQWQRVRGQVCLRTDIHEDLDLAMHLHEAGYQIRYDKTIKVRAELRRVQTERHKLWDYLGWLPQTFRVHGKKSWPLVWLVGVPFLYTCATALALLGHLCKDGPRKL